MATIKANVLGGKPLFDIWSYGRRGPTRRDRLSPAKIALISRTAHRVPEVMVKVTSGGGAVTARGVNAHFSYISRKDELELETDEGERLSGRGAGQQLIEDWDLDMEEDRKRSNLFAIDRRKAPKLVHRVIFLMPAGTPPIVDSKRDISKKTHNNVVSVIGCAFEYGYRDHPEKHNPASALKCVRLTKKDRGVPDPFSIQEAEALIADIHLDWGEAQGNYDEFRFFTGLRPSEQIALLVDDCDLSQGELKVSKACVMRRNKDRTKTGEDRLVELCPRAIGVLKRQLALSAIQTRWQD